MPRVCKFTGRRTSTGRTYTLRGKAKYLGGVGTKVTGITRRKFKPNLQKVRVTTPEGENKTVRLCTQCLRSGAVTRVVRRRPFDLPEEK